MLSSKPIAAEDRRHARIGGVAGHPRSRADDAVEITAVPPLDYTVAMLTLLALIWIGVILVFLVHRWIALGSRASGDTWEDP